MKIGDKVYYSDRSEKDAKTNEYSGELVADISHRGDTDYPYVVMYSNGEINGWKHAVPAEDEYEPFTYETFPDGIVMFKHKTKEHKGIVTETYDNSLRVGRYYMTYPDFMSNYLVSLDMGKTWQVAGVIKTGESE